MSVFDALCSLVDEKTAFQPVCRWYRLNCALPRPAARTGYLRSQLYSSISIIDEHWLRYSLAKSRNPEDSVLDPTTVVEFPEHWASDGPRIRPSLQQMRPGCPDRDRIRIRAVERTGALINRSSQNVNLMPSSQRHDETGAG